jgi:hypothetical protein
MQKEQERQSLSDLTEALKHLEWEVANVLNRLWQGIAQHDYILRNNCNTEKQGPRVTVISCEPASQNARTSVSFDVPGVKVQYSEEVVEDRCGYWAAQMLNVSNKGEDGV